MNQGVDPLQVVDDINALSSFLARQDVPALSLLTHVDVIVLLGSSVLQTAKVASEAFAIGIAERILVVGGVGHSTNHLWEAVRTQADLSSIEVEGRPEAEILRDVLSLRHGVPASAMLIENRSTNCGSNAWEAKRVLEEGRVSYHRLLLIQDPTMQRRTHASFERAWRGHSDVEFISYAPFVTKTGLTADGEWELNPNAWSSERFMSLILGEIPRLIDHPTGYGPKGRDFIEHVELPTAVLEAHQRLNQVNPQTSR